LLCSEPLTRHWGQCAAAIANELTSRWVNMPFFVVSNPEFLKEVAAVDDLWTHLMRALYAPLQGNLERMIITDIKSAELTKYATNGIKATHMNPVIFGGRNFYDTKFVREQGIEYFAIRI